MFIVKIGLLLLQFKYCFATESHVIVLDDKNFFDHISIHEFTLVMFYAPWCGHCNKMKPAFEKAALELKYNDPAISLSKVDCANSGKDICSKYAINEYPTLKIFRNGKFVMGYDGPRDALGIVKYMQTQAKPSSVIIKTNVEFQDFINANEVGIVGFFADDNNLLKDAYFKLRKHLNGKYRFAHTFNEEIAKKYNTSDNIILFRPKMLRNKFEDHFVKYNGIADTDSMENFIKENLHGFVGYRHAENVQEFSTPLVVAYYNVDYIKNLKGTNYWRNRILQVAKDFHKIFNFAISPANEFQSELFEFGAGAVGDKPIIFARDAKNQKYAMKEEFSLDAFKKFLIDLKHGKLSMFIKSQPIPENNDQPVKVVVARNFNEIITHNDKDILIKFYAPWCGHCKQFAPIYEELGQLMENEDVEIVKMDASNNDVEWPYEINEFPTIYWVPKDNKNMPEIYEDDRDLDNFIKFIAKRSTNELKLYDRNGNWKTNDEL